MNSSACGLNAMSAYSTLSRCVLLGSRHLEDSMAVIRPVMVRYGYRPQAYCGRVSAKLQNHECWGSNMLYKFFWSNASGCNRRSKISPERGIEDSETFCTDPHSAAATADADLDYEVVPNEEQVEDPPVVADKYVAICFAYCDLYSSLSEIDFMLVLCFRY